MKIVKDTDQSLLFSGFAVQGRHFMALAVLYFFDLSNPDTALKEKDMWTQTSTYLNTPTGPGALDAAMAKPRGEFLIYGSCYAKDARPVQGMKVSATVGPLRKELYVFGDRHWEHEEFSEPLPFVKKPLTWEYAFGGPGFEKNPAGKGYWSHKQKRPSELPLPNLENPNALLVTPKNRPNPACLLPVDAANALRQKKAGTYDAQWKRAHWPYPPPDFDWSFYNTASPDQQLGPDKAVLGGPYADKNPNAFFQAAAPIELKGLHPEHHVVTSTLPALRPRLFVSLYEDLKKKDPNRVRFVEVDLVIDTVILFPEIMRGVVIHRGVCTVADDEYSDVGRIMIVTERIQDTPRQAQEYYEEQKKRLSRDIPLDLAPLKEVGPEIQSELEKLKKLPLQIEKSVAQETGKLPKPFVSTDQKLANSAASAEQAARHVDEAQTMADSLSGRFGHNAPIPQMSLFGVKQAIIDAHADLKAAAAQAKAVEAATAKFDAEAAEDLTRLQAKDPLIRTDTDVQASLSPDPPETNPEALRREQAIRFLSRCREALMADSAYLERLRELGIPPQRAEEHFIGLNREHCNADPVLWGFAPEQPLEIPRGLVIPAFDGATPSRIIIRRGNLESPDNDWKMNGFADTPGVLGLGEALPVCITKDPLEALLLHQETEGLCRVLPLADPKEKLAPDDAQALQASPRVFVVRPHGDDPHDTYFLALKKIFPQAEFLPLPKGKTVFEARSHGQNLRAWLLAALPDCKDEPQAVVKSLKGPLEGVPGGFTLPAIDFDALAAKCTAMLERHTRATAPPEAFPDSEVEAAIQEERDKLAAYSMDYDHIQADNLERAGGLTDLPESAPADPAEKLEYELRELAKDKEHFAKIGLLDDDLESTFEQTAQDMQKMAAMSAQMDQKAAKRAQQESAYAALPLPDKARTFGGDPLNREQVQALLEQGRTLEGANLSGADLSKLDLSGIKLANANLAQADCSGAKLCKADLTAALLAGTVLDKADCSKALLDNARLSDCFLRDTILSAASLSATALDNCDLSRADLTDAQLQHTALNNCACNKAKLSGLNAELTAFAGCDLSDTDFSNARLTRCLFLDTPLNNTQFRTAVFNNTLFQGAKGRNTVFSQAKSTGLRIMKGCDFSGCNFSHMDSDSTTFMSAILRGCDFTCSRLEKALIQDCELVEACFFNVRAKGTRFDKSDLEKANMRGVNLLGGSLRKARLVDTDFEGSNLYAVNFFKAVFGNTNLQRANLARSLLADAAEVLR